MESETIKAPANNTSYPTPATVTISANAADSDGTISKVDFYNGASLITTVTTAPYSVTLAGFAAGSYTFTAVATDNSNAATTSSAVSITVTAANVPPTVSIITPADNTSYTAPANFSIAVNATDSDGTITKVDFYNGATLLSTATSAPYALNISNASNVGNYLFTAVATDNSGASTTSSPIHISITNTSQTPQVYYIHTDQLNTPRLITDSNNAKVWEWSNDDPFGNNPPNDDPNATGSHFNFNQRFAGQYFDKETNTNYNYFRDYDPELGTYRQSDPIGLAGGINTYTYVKGNPISYVDPRGLMGGRGGALLARKLPAVDNPCVEKYIHDYYGDLGGFIATIGNTQQYLPSANDDYLSADSESLKVLDEKLVATKLPGTVGNMLMKASPGSLSVGNVAGAGLAKLSSLASGVGEVAGAIMTPFGTAAMAMARESCSCGK